MGDKPKQRRLAAILAADVVGYTQLVEKNTEGTVAAWTAARDDIIKPGVEEKFGTIIKFTGDGFLVEFSSVQDAVTCAIDLQDKLAAGPLNFRMGVNLGDIMDDGGDVHGEGVNIAARLEALAEPGGIYVSGDVYNQVRNRIEVAFEDMGERTVKHVSQPVHIYRVASQSPPGSDSGSLTKATPPRTTMVFASAVIFVAAIFATAWFGLRPSTSPDTETSAVNNEQAPIPAETKSLAAQKKPSVAVLPFNNMSGDKEQEYFSDGMTEDLITDLSKISALTVISRTSSFAYKGPSPDVREVGKALHVSHIVEGSVRKAGGKVRITVQLIDAATGSHLWADRYDREIKDIFALQDEVSGKIVAALAVKLTPLEEKSLARPLTTSTEAYEYYLKGLQQVSFFTRDANTRSQNLFRKATELDPEFASAYAYLAQAYSISVENDWAENRDEMIKKAVETAKMAIEIDGELPYAFWSLGRIYSRAYMRKQKLALTAFQKSIALNPNYADGYMMLGSVQIQVGQAEQALGNIEKGMRINPGFPFWYFHTLGQAQLSLTRYAAAADSFEKAIERNPAVDWPRRWLVAAYGHLGRLDDAEWELSELEGLGLPLTLKSLDENFAGRDPGYMAILFDGFRKAGVPEE